MLQGLPLQAWPLVRYRGQTLKDRIMQLVTLKQARKGEYIKLKPTESAPVWIRGDYCRSTNKYEIFKAEDCNHVAMKKAASLVYIGFTY